MADTYAWKLKGNLKGPKGDKGDPGEQGVPGAAGRSLRVANVNVLSNSDVALSAISPAAGIAVDDLILDAAGDLYTVTSTAEDKVHVSNAIGGVNLKGPKGDPGDKGADGARGNTITNGTTAPTDAAGRIGGDLYVDTSTFDFYVYEQAAA